MNFTIVYLCLVMIMLPLAYNLISEAIFNSYCNLVDIDTIYRYIMGSILLTEAILLFIRVLIEVIT